MTDRPIIFSSVMVRALLAGRKTQTRRLATSPLRLVEVGDRLWVREAHRLTACSCTEACRLPGNVLYEAGGNDDPFRYLQNRLRPSIHMPRWASRLTLIVEAVKVEPLQTISEADAIAEGLTALSKDRKLVKYGLPDRDGLPGNDDDGWHWQDWDANPAVSFRRLWNSLHTRDGERWQDNPLVVALTFRVERANIDQVAA